MYMDPFEPFRESQRNLREAVRKATVIQSVDMPKMISTQKIAAQLKTDWSAINNATKINKESLSNALSIQRQLGEFSNTIMHLSKPSFQFNHADMTKLLDSAKYMQSISESIKPIRMNVTFESNPSFDLFNAMQTRSLLFNVNRIDDEYIAEYIESDESIEVTKEELIQAVLISTAFIIISLIAHPMAFNSDSVFPLSDLFLQQTVQSADKKAQDIKNKDE